MKKVKFMRLNLKSENYLSKEEKKEILGGQICYVRCGGDVHVMPANGCYEAIKICRPDDHVDCCVCGGSC